MGSRWLRRLSGAVLVALVAGLGALGGHLFAAPAADALAPLPLRAGPIPDYAPIDSVWTHPQLLTIAPELAATLTRYLGEQHRIETWVPPPPEATDEELSEDPDVDGDALDREDSSLVWIRDYQPIFVRRPDGGIKVLRYLHHNPNRSSYLPLGHPTADPFPPARQVEREPSFELLPLLHENGNLVVAGRWVLLTDLIFEDNGLEDGAPHLVAAGYAGMDAGRVLARLARALGRHPREIVILPRMPGEQTGHVDLFVMALSDAVVMVPRVPREALRVRADAVDPALAEEVRLFLDDVARRLERLGLEVVRLPMVPPLVLDSVDADEPPDPVFFSPANGLLLRTADRARVLLPAADLRAVAPGLAPLQRKYERLWSRVFRARGWQPTRVDATELARYLGLFRCVSQVVPAR